MPRNRLIKATIIPIFKSFDVINVYTYFYSILEFLDLFIKLYFYYCSNIYFY